MENDRVYLASEESTEEEEDETDEESSQSDSGTDVSEVGMFDVPKPQTAVQKPASENHPKPLVSFNKAREVVIHYFCFVFFFGKFLAISGNFFRLADRFPNLFCAFPIFGKFMIFASPCPSEKESRKLDMALC